jgi:hypothetical protein
MNKNFWENTAYALREIALIVIGVLIAVWIDNWNERKKDRALEIKTLRALKEGLQQDSADIALNIKGLDNTINWRVKVGKIAKKELPMDSLKEISYFGTTSFFLNNVAPYESLKSLGLAKITNDTLRHQIITLYELEYKILTKTEEDINERIVAYNQTYAEKVFFWGSQKKPFQDILYEFQKDKDFQFHNYTAISNEHYQLRLQTEMLPKINRLIRNLEKECR